jgi:NADH-quinone oxidoreductase subunit C
MSALAFDAIAAAVRAAVPAAETRKADNGWPYLLVPAAAIVEVVRLLRTRGEFAFDALMDLSGCDLMKYPAPAAAHGAAPAAKGAAAAPPPSTAIAVVYQLFSYRHRHRVTLRVEVPRDACALPTVSGEWPAALYFEREVWDLLGAVFTGHPSLHRIMCPDDWVGHPLRKDYVYPASYHDVAHLRDGQHFEGAPPRAQGSA